MLSTGRANIFIPPFNIFFSPERSIRCMSRHRTVSENMICGCVFITTFDDSGKSAHRVDDGFYATCVFTMSSSNRFSAPLVSLYRQAVQRRHIFIWSSCSKIWLIAYGYYFSACAVTADKYLLAWSCRPVHGRTAPSLYSISAVHCYQRDLYLMTIVAFLYVYRS